MTQTLPGGTIQGWTHDPRDSVLALGWNSGKGGIYFFFLEFNSGRADTLFCWWPFLSPCGQKPAENEAKTEYIKGMEITLSEPPYPA